MSSLLHRATVRVVRPQWAAEIVSPPYDLLSRSARRHLAESRPRSFLNATRSPDDFPGMGPRDVIEVAKAYMADRLAEDAYGPELAGCFVYRLTARSHVQTGVVADVPVAAFPARVRPHESTRVEREDQLSRYLADVGLTSSPVGLTYRARPDIDRLVEGVVEGPPLLDLIADEERQQVWLAPPGLDDALIEAFGGVDATYIIDGHHRAAAARRLLEALGVDESSKAGRILAVAFPDHDLRVYSYDRWIDAEWPSGAGWHTSEPPDPGPGETIVLSSDGWLRADLEPRVGELDSSALSREILAPRFGVADERTDARLVFIPGALGKATVRARVDRRGGVGFLLHPASVEDLMSVSDLGGVMPPKSTFFAPKPRSGIFLADRRP